MSEKSTQEYFGNRHRTQWKTQGGFILAAIGSAIGLGNIWRFSYLCFKNGGGAFLIPYFIALFVVGIPLMMLEFGLGHREKGSAPKSFFRISSKWEWLGWWPVIFVMFGIMLYYSTVISWCLNYFFFSITQAWGSDPNTFFFNKFLNISKGPGNLVSIQSHILLGLIGVWFLCWLIVYFGVDSGIERANKILMPLLFLMTIILVIWSMTLPNAMAGIREYLRPDFSSLSRPEVWVDAFSQIFFTLSLGFGIMIAYASYLPRKSDLTGSALITSLANCVYSVIAGLAVWGTLGYMAGIKGVPIQEVVNKSIGLAFVTYPQAISVIPVFSSLFGLLFFAILVFAGISSAISIIEAFTSSVIDKFHFPRTSVVSAICVAGFFGSIIFATGAGLYWLDIVDHFLTTYGLVTIGLLECVVVAWCLPPEELRNHLNDVSSIMVGKWWDISIKIITPGILMVLLCLHLFHEFSSAYEGYPVAWLIIIGRDWLLVTLVAAILASNFKWRPRKSIQS